MIPADSAAASTAPGKPSGDPAATTADARTAAVLARLAARPEPCFDLLGGRILDGDVATGTIRLAFAIDPRWAHGIGVQGGIVAAMLDNAMAFAVLLASDLAATPPTLALTVQYLAAARPGAFVATGRVVRLGRSVAFMTADLADPAGTPVATATATAAVRWADGR